MWERTLQDLIRGLRANKKDESRFISQAIDEIRGEIKSKDMELKAAAVLKLTYLEMLGYDMKWASFYIVEVMSSQKLHLKSLGYLAAAQSFDQETDVLMLTTNLLKKDLNSTHNETSVALDGLSNIVTPDLARDLSKDLYAILNHSRANVRKRAVLVLYKLFLRYPETLEQNFSRLKEKLEDPDPGVVSATINVLCELARTKPREYLPLAPQLFHILTTSSNNWMLIKVIKLFGRLTPLEPRLVKKLQAPISELISSTPAISLLYECVHTCITGAMLEGPAGHSLAETCVRKLATFLQDPDQNLKYIALLALVKIVPSHPHLLAEYQDVILASASDVDLSIRMRVLELLSAMVDRSNIQPIVQHLLQHLVNPQSSSAPPQSATESLIRTASGLPLSASTNVDNGYRLEVSKQILNMCSRGGYENIDNFEWVLSVLVDLAYVGRVDVGAEIKDRLVEVVLRQPSIRAYAVKLMSKLLEDDTFILNAGEGGGCSETLGAAAWICGEYASLLNDPIRVLHSICHPGFEGLCSGIVMTVISSALKIFGEWAAAMASDWNLDKLHSLERVSLTLTEGIERFTSHFDLEVQERACSGLQLLLLVTVDVKQFQAVPPELKSSAHVDSSVTPHFELSFPKSLFLLKPLFTIETPNEETLATHENIDLPPEVDFNDWLVSSEADRGIELSKPQANGQSSVLHVRKTTKRSKAASQLSSGANDKKMRSIHARDTTGAGDPESSSGALTREQSVSNRVLASRANPYYINDPSPRERELDDDIDSIPIVNLGGLIIPEVQGTAPDTAHQLGASEGFPQPFRPEFPWDQSPSTHWQEDSGTLPVTGQIEQEATPPEPQTTKVIKVKKKKKGLPKNSAS